MKKKSSTIYVVGQMHHGIFEFNVYSNFLFFFSFKLVLVKLNKLGRQVLTQSIKISNLLTWTSWSRFELQPTYVWV